MGEYFEKDKSNQSQESVDVSSPDSGDTDLILLAEDNAANIVMISSYLKAKGFDLVVAKNGLEAIELLEHHPVKLILMDIQMPEMDGLEAMAVIRENPEYNSIPIIALTALAMDGDREKCLSAGANEYLSKPVRLKKLNRIIRDFLSMDQD